jgi:DNA-binding CsgD family transcriptional regulator
MDLDLISRYLSGVPLPILAADTGLSEAALRKAMHRAGHYRGPRHQGEATRAEVVRLAGEGLSGRAIARQLNIGREAVRRLLKGTPNVTDARNEVSPCPNG